MTGAMLLTWLPQIGLPLGDSHEGRILARLGMQAANVWRLGLVGSRWGTSLEPYDPNGFYAHHPPLINILHVIAAGMLGGDQPWHLRIPGYLAGLATLVAVALLLRALELGWAPTLLAVGAMAATPMFWVYGRLGAGFSVLAGFAAIVAHLRRIERPGRGVVATAAVLAALTVLLSWPGAIGGALLGAWLWRRRGLDGITRLVLGGWCCGALLLVALARRVRRRRRSRYPGERPDRRHRPGRVCRASVVVRHRVVHLVVAVARDPGAGSRVW